MKCILPMQVALLALAAFAIAQPGPPQGQPYPPGQPAPAPDIQDNAPDAPDGQYEPGRAVARISVLNGDVSLRRGDSGDVVAAAVNAPVMGGDAILTGSSSRGEVQLDSANMLRFAPNSEIRFVGMDTKYFQMQIASGTVLLRVLGPGEAQVELDTPSVAVRALRPGVYRITVREDGTSEITVRSGEAEIGSPRGTERLAAGRTMNARGQASDPEYQVTGAIPYDSWDRWNEDRDRYLESSRSYEHVGRDVTGAQDLDQNGRWINDPTYGQVWAPTVPPGWAPYQNGRWVWEDYYGWTWVSYDPWGWAPYHYGRWFYGPVGWAWYPGPVFGPHYWAPAYVGFFGWGGGLGVGVGFGFGNIGWVALAPFESFHPWWGRGFYGGYRTGFVSSHTTIVNNVNIMNTYRNARVAGGVMGVSAAGFGRGERFTAVNGSQIQRAGLVHGVLPVSPDRSSLRMSDRAAAGNFRQSSIQNFAGRSAASNISRVPFEQQQRSMQQLSRANFNAPNRGGFGSAGRGASTPETHGWARFGEPIHSSSPQGGVRPGNVGGGTANGYSRPANNFAQGARPNGGGQAVRISPPMLQRAPQPQGARGPAPSYQAPRSYPNGNGGGGNRSGGGRSSGSGRSGGSGHGGRR
jgi:hypothetical protein